MALTKQERRTQKTVLKQRDEARTELERLKSRLDAVERDAMSMAQEDIDKAKKAQAAAEAVRDIALEQARNAVVNASYEAKATIERLEADLGECRQIVRLQETTINRLEQEQRQLSDILSKLQEENANLKKNNEALLEDLGGDVHAENEKLRRRLREKASRIEELEKRKVLNVAPLDAVDRFSDEALDRLTGYIDTIKARRKAEAQLQPEPTVQPAVIAP